MITTIVLVVAFLFLKNSTLASALFSGASSGTAPYAIAPQTINVAAQPGQQQNEAGAASAAGNAIKLIPVVGPALSQVFNALSAGLIQASAKRRAQAVSENQAVAAAIPGWDAAITQIVNGYNGGSLSLSQATQLIEQQWSLYWQEVGGVIQPGRNGCQSGAVSQPKGVSFCGGDYGAACCVGYDDLRNSSNNIEYALQQTDATGKPIPASILPIFASKYGGSNRAGYTVTVTRPNSVFSI